MKQQGSGKGYGVRYETPAEVIEKERKSAPGPGLFLNYSRRWCYVCGQTKESKWKKRGNLFSCADCDNPKS
jgi:hypothetical protein